MIKSNLDVLNVVEEVCVPMVFADQDVFIVVVVRCAAMVDKNQIVLIVMDHKYVSIEE
jgi:hypothetical protein